MGGVWGIYQQDFSQKPTMQIIGQGLTGNSFYTGPTCCQSLELKFGRSMCKSSLKKRKDVSLDTMQTNKRAIYLTLMDSVFLFSYIKIKRSCPKIMRVS